MKLLLLALISNLAIISYPLSEGAKSKLNRPKTENIEEISNQKNYDPYWRYIIIDSNNKLGNVDLRDLTIFFGTNRPDFNDFTRNIQPNGDVYYIAISKTPIPMDGYDYGDYNPTNSEGSGFSFRQKNKYQNGLKFLDGIVIALPKPGDSQPYYDQQGDIIVDIYIHL